ncbi:TRAP transporter large permease subunit [Neobacillus niacini]|uniref:TRAP transporter large permease subunit n=1 Tax=Neobacillus niacini TaxID=86668 RepID=UPI00187C1E7F
MKTLTESIRIYKIQINRLFLEVLAVPLIYPLIENLGFDLIWFGIVATVMAEIRMIHPPLGLNVFVATSVTGTKIEDALQVYGGM